MIDQLRKKAGNLSYPQLFLFLSFKLFLAGRKRYRYFCSCFAPFLLFSFGYFRFCASVTRKGSMLHTLFCDEKQKEGVREVYNSWGYQEKREALLYEAEKAVGGRVNVLGSGEYHFTGGTEWHTDIITGYRWKPNSYWEKLETETPHIAEKDLKLPWDVSISHQLIRLGQAYILTGEERYARKVTAQIRSFIDDNPVFYGVNWACPMIPSLRICNFLLAVEMIAHSPSVDRQFLITFQRAVYEHGLFIRRNLEFTYRGTSNHYLSNITALAFCGLALRDYDEPAEWLKFAKQELEKEMQKQVFEDGVDYEASISYHRLVLELFLYPAIALKRGGDELSASFYERMRKMLDFTACYTKPDGTAPQIGDSDNGVLFQLEVFLEEGEDKKWGGNLKYLDHRYLLFSGGAFFNDTALMREGEERKESALWVMGKEVLTDYETGKKEEKASALQSKLFPYGSCAVLRYQSDYLFFAAFPNGIHGEGSHTHNDKLSFELASKGETLYYDPNSFCYTRDAQQRNIFRSTQVHNTVMIDGAEINRIDPKQLFWSYDDAKTSFDSFSTSEKLDVAEASHTGFLRLSSPVLHRRRVAFHKNPSCWFIEDSFEGTGEHRFAWSFQLSPFAEVKHLPSEALPQRKVCQLLEFFGCGKERISHIAELRTSKQCFYHLALGVDVQWSVEEAFVSFGYNHKIPAPRLRFFLTAEAPAHCGWLLFSDDTLNNLS